MSSPSCCSRSPPRCRPSGLLTACAALSSSASCQQASPGQFAVLYAAVWELVVVVVAGTRFTAVTFGADQFGSARDQDTFYIVSLYASCLVGETAIVYLQESVSWALGHAPPRSARLPEAQPSSAQPFARLASIITSENLAAVVLRATRCAWDGDPAFLQALAMGRSLRPRRFKIQAGSMTRTLTAFIVGTAVLNRARIGLGDVVNISAMVAAALVERRWLGVVHAHHGEDDEAAGKVVATMSILWLFIPLGLVGEFPKTLRSMATAMAPLLIALGFYFGTVIVGVVRWVTAWLPANVNHGRLDNVYWTVAVAVAAKNKN
ncbi:hypothetical protein HU200_020905 [Digitaria exilis]|uniref:Uncharacterized protein n=1 Tax=Digitaria exilis TaxID=1010633 RepID=A0A835F0R6_9POAL|nr:hypothetical protein HU200_020905 [Digitaria exilis]